MGEGPTAYGRRDARVLKAVIVHGRRRRRWELIDAESSESAFKDWPLVGPRTAKYCIEFLVRQPGGAEEHHMVWRSLCKLNPGDWGVAEHELIMSAVKLAGEYDQLNLPSLAL